ncbi:MAG: hypothetical protein WCF67_22405 [Chitinophagaceae bacterium]
MTTLEDKFKNMHLLSREERTALTKQLRDLKPDFLKPYVPIWWWWRRCIVKVLVVADGGLNFGIGGFDLSEFLTSFNQLQATTWSNYQITLGHRGTIIPSTNPLVVNQLSNFNFQTSVTLNDFDQVWLFGIDSGSGLPAAELTVVENYMNSGGGLFATGDHGTLGSALSSNITRVKDMRYWNDNPVGSPNDVNEVSMSGKRRNDTNRPKLGDATSLYFDNQSDNIPQTIAVRTFGAGMPHPLLSISTTIRPSGIIDIMPDHPHEGECKPATSFTANAVTVPTQVIATSFVLGGSTTNGGSFGKALTEPHCFPSIAVWDGRLANVGRIVVDATWHHFVNINLNGVGSNGSDLPGQQPGLTAADFNVVRQYYMNISLWMSRRQSWWCWRRFLWIELLKDSQLIEASLNFPDEKLENISLADLNSIGSLADEILSSKFSPSFAREFLIDAFESINPNIASLLNIFKPVIKEKTDTQDAETQDADYYQPWLNLDLILYTSIGAGFIALRDDKNISSDSLAEDDLDRTNDVFKNGMMFGFNKSIENLSKNLNTFSARSDLKI